jgi:hypothetical protein
MPLAVALVRMNIRPVAQVGLDEHLEILASPSSELETPARNLIPHLVSEGNSLRAGGLAHADVVAEEATAVDVFPMKTIDNRFQWRSG